MVGKTVGKYRVIERIGRGGMGIVYKAVDETLDRPVAIKVLNAEFGDAAVLKRFRAEAVTLARLNHQGIATIYELNRQDDEFMMVMEYVRGETLHQFAERIGPLDPPHAAHLCMQVLDALSHAHRAGVVHRDLKPANLMVTDTGAVKVMDFGIARVLGAENYTLGGLTMGTPAYMSPEQVTGQAIDARSDLYSVGVVFYRLLSGRLPFVADTAIAMAQKQISDQPTPLSDIRPDLPQWCTIVVERALAKDPAQRYQSADEFRVVLASAVVPQSIGELPTLATPTLGTALSGVTPPPTADQAFQSGSVKTTSAATSNETATQPTAPTRRLGVSPPAATVAGTNTTTTVVLGRSHVFAIGALIVTLTVGVLVLGIAAYRGTFSRTPASSPAVDVPPQAPPEAPPQATPAAAPEPSSGGVAATEPAVAPATSPAPPLPSVVPPASSARGTPPPPKPNPSAATPPPPPAAATPTVAPPPTTSVEPSAAPAVAAPAETAAALPTVAFANVRMLVTESDRLRDKRGVLRIGSNEIVMSEGNESRVLTSTRSVRSLHYSRSRQPRWRDEAGREVMPKVDLGRFGFFRGDRNWLILMGEGEPIILSVEDPQLRHILDAFQTRTGLTVQRFR